MRLLAALSMSCILVACDAANNPAPSTKTSRNVDLAFCDTLETSPDPRFANYKECVYAACSAGDEASCEMARSYNGNLRADDQSSPE